MCAVHDQELFHSSEAELRISAHRAPLALTVTCKFQKQKKKQYLFLQTASESRKIIERVTEFSYIGNWIWDFKNGIDSEY
jgi:hypothetical protein